MKILANKKTSKGGIPHNAVEATRARSSNRRHIGTAAACAAFMICMLQSWSACTEEVLQKNVIQWNHTLSFKNNYLYANAFEIDENPVMQFETRGQFNNGTYVDLWINVPLDRPSNSAEIDWTVGHKKPFATGNLDMSLAYYDVDFPHLFDNSSDLWAPKVVWLKDNYYVEAIRYVADMGRDGTLLGTGASKDFGKGWSVLGRLKYVDGPYTNQEVVVTNLRFTHYRKNRFFETVSLELTDLLYHENDNEPRGFAVTLALQKPLSWGN